MVVVARVAEDDHGRLRADLAAVTIPEHLERMPVVGVSVDPDDIGLGVDPVDGVGDVLDPFEEPGHLVDAVDEHERSHPGELPRDGVDELEGETGEGGHRTGDVGDDEDLGLGRARIAELRIDGDAAVAQRMPHSVAEVERTLAPMAPLARQPHRQLAGERIDRLSQAQQLLATGVHEVDIFGKGLAQRLGHGLDTAIGHETATDLGLDLLLEAVDTRLELVLLETLLERREWGRCLIPGLLQESFEHVVEIEIPKRAIEVIGATHRSPRLHTGIAGDRLPGERPHHGVVALLQRVEEHLGHLFGRERLSPAAPGTRTSGVGVRGGVVLIDLELGLAPVEGVLRSAQREVDLEHGLERTPVRVVLHQCRSERVLERVAILDRDVGDGLHRVEVLGETHRQPGGAQFNDEPRQEFEHGGIGGLHGRHRAITRCAEHRDGACRRRRPVPWWPE